MTKLPFRERLEPKPILADGAMGTMLHAQENLPIDTCFDLLNLTDPAAVASVHRRYIEEGAEIIETNTFSANTYKLGACGMESECAAINRAGVELARKVIESSLREDVYLAGSIGPLGVRLAPFGRITPEEAFSAFMIQIGALLEAGVDLLIFETFSDLSEIVEAIHAARTLQNDVPIIAQMTFTRDDRTTLGDTPAQVARALYTSGADVIGVNCSSGPTQLAAYSTTDAPCRAGSAFFDHAQCGLARDGGWARDVYRHARLFWRLRAGVQRGGRVRDWRLLWHDARARPRYALGAG